MTKHRDPRHGTHHTPKRHKLRRMENALRYLNIECVASDRDGAVGREREVLRNRIAAYSYRTKPRKS